MKYDKPPLNIDQQIDTLVERGLIVRNRQEAHQFLSEINYYRLSAYFLPFLKDKTKHLFFRRTSFEKIIRLYRFDEALRNIVMPIVESAEILVRMRMTYFLVTKYSDAFCYLKKEIYSRKFLGLQISREDFKRFLKRGDAEAIWNELIEKEYIDRKGNVKKRDVGKLGVAGRIKEVVDAVLRHSPYDEWMEKMDRSIKASKEEFVRHYLDTYYEDSPGFPLWMASEIISFGQLSKLYAGLNGDDRKAIAGQFGLPHRVFGKWLHTLVYLRNMCAHYSRLWNRVLEIRPTCPRDLPERRFWSDRMFSVLIVLKYLTPRMFNWGRIVLRLSLLFAWNRFVDKRAMGFPKGWAMVLLKR